LLCSACAIQAPQHSKPDNWIGVDKLAHFTASAVIAAAVTNYQQRHGSGDCEAARIGFTVSLAVGASKEYYDKTVKRTRWSWKDFTWDVIGSGVGSLAAADC
jgi:putative lipoprotein